MFERDEVGDILCDRGGYGCNYLLPKVNLEKIKAQPKIFVGYSDITTLLTYFTDVCGMVTFHGPMVAKDFSEDGHVQLSSWSAAVGGEARWGVQPEGIGRVGPGSAEGGL